MRLEKFRITNYRSIDDSGWIECNENVLCLVGKNESGKTSLLVALEKLSPVEKGRESFTLEKDYPRKGLNQYKRTHAKNPANVIDAVFSLTEKDVATIAEALGPDVVSIQQLHVKKGYDNVPRVECMLDERVAVRNAILATKPAQDVLAKLNSNPTLDDLEKLAAADAALQPAFAAAKTAFPKGVAQKVTDVVYGEVPDFLYFDDYSVMHGRVSLPTMQTLRKQTAADKNTKVKRADRTFLALLDLAGTTPDELIQSRASTEKLTAGLEAAAIDITKEVFEFWTQNKSLRVSFQILDADQEDEAAGRQGPIFHTRIWNDRHQMTVSFDERSRGFVWFFSFLAYFSRVKEHPRPVILLLDEPGLSLHAMAQADFLRFIEKRLAPAHQVLFTTHSPFMVDANEPGRIRLVEDSDQKGTVVSADLIRTRHGEDTLYPLLAAMGIGMTQTLFVGPNTLLVEGPSEFLYFPALSKLLTQSGKAPLDPRWTVTPVNGGDKAPAFVSLFGANKLHVAVVLDYEPKKKKLIENLRNDRHLKPERVIPLTDITRTNEADIEDLFDPAYYLAIVNAAYKHDLRGEIKLPDLKGGERIVPRLEHYFEAQGIGKAFGHAFVAEYFARHTSDFAKPDAKTLSRFEELFGRLNKILDEK